ncbi:dynamin-like [Contarinia nasturtii]|uniref:dynamin-like n=1 Tax=Contarinia nasturtii TaxID=265458 RepID=UPI0012D3E271|nr:dynamin-like [Contarinia nasturtii]
MLPTSQTVNKMQQDNEIGNPFEGVENTVEVKSDDNKSTSSEEGHDSQPEDNQFVNKGNLCIENLGNSRSYWFVLTLKTLSWYEKEDEKDQIFTLPLNGLQLYEVAQNPQSQKHVIALFYPDGRNVYQNQKQLKLSSENDDDINTWKQFFSRSFISETNKKEEREQVDPTLNGEVEVIYEKIDSYMRIVKKTTRDMVPKATTLYVIKELQEYINNTLLIELLALPTDVNTKLFALSSVEAEKHKEKEKTYEACKEALEIIRDVSMETGNGTITDNGF